MNLKPITKFKTKAPVAVIGDIHGDIHQLESLLRKLPPGIQIITTGDVCDRGPNSKDVIDKLVDIKAKGVMGNHDEWLWKWAKFGEFSPHYLRIGAEATLTSYGSIGQTLKDLYEERHLVPKDHLKWLEGLSVVMDLQVQNEKYWVIHAGIHIDMEDFAPKQKVVETFSKSHQNHLMWIHNYAEDTLKTDRTVIMGHTIHEEPVDVGKTIAVDTGCSSYHGGYLSAVVLPERRFVSTID